MNRSALSLPVASNALNVLYVEDNPGDAGLLREMLKETGIEFKLVCAESLSQARRELLAAVFDIIFLDLSLPDAQGLETVKQIWAVASEVPIVVMTGLKDEAVGIQCVQAGAQDYLVKGHCDGALLKRVLRYIMERQRTLGLTRTTGQLQGKIAEREKAEAALGRVLGELKKSQVDLMHAQRIAHLGSWGLELNNLEDRNQNPLHWSEEVYRIFGLAPDSVTVTNALFFEKVHPEDRQKVQEAVSKALEQRTPYSIEHRIRRPSGEERVVQTQAEIMFDESGRPLRMRGTVLDVTERVHLEDQVRQAQKMESIGRMAGGLAHDFNNILTIMNGYLDILLPQFSEDGRARKDLLEIKLAATQAASLTRQLLAFSRKQVLQPRVLLLNHVVTTIEQMLRRLMGEDIELVAQLDVSIDPIKVDPGQIEQILMNLAANARDAMPKGGRLTIETAQVKPEDEGTGARVMLCVRDSGCGMDEIIQSHLFEPFYTTKGIGKGTGLGLATVYGIVQQSGGTIQVESAPTKGTAFRMYFPAVLHVVPPVPVPGSAPAPATQGRGETILVVEDEPHIRALLRRVLTQKGHRVMEASQGEEALALCRQPNTPIDLVVTDMVMPRMGGREFTEALRQVSPHLKILYMSGYTDHIALEQGPFQDGATFIQKPFDVNDLAAKIRNLIDMVAKAA